MWLNVHKRQWALSGLGYVFGMSFRVGYRYWARSSGLWAVRVTKKSARAISITTLIVLLLLPFSMSVCSLTPILLCSVYFDGAEIKDTIIEM